MKLTGFKKLAGIVGPAWLAVMALLSASCGYRHQALFPTDVRTVAVPLFENKTFYRGVEFDLTEALVKEIELRTPYKVVNGVEAQSVLQGSIRAIDQTRLTRERVAGLPQEMELRLVVDFAWKDQRNGQILRERKGFAAVGRYIPSQNVGEPLELGQHQAVELMAREIVSTLRGQW